MSYRKCLFLLAFLFITKIVQGDEAAPSKIIVGYYPAWAVYEGNLVSDIPADKLTHISYTFANISPDLECQLGDSWSDIEMPFEGDDANAPLKGNFHQLQLLKEKHPALKTLIAVGGWTGSLFFSDVALTQESREKFVTSCVKFMKDYGFDGIEVSWNYPTGVGNPKNHKRPQDASHFVLLMEEFRKQLNIVEEADTTHYLLAITAGPSYRQMKGVPWWRIHQVLDWINVIAYDFSGPWSELTGFNSPLYYPSRNPPEGGSINTSMVRYVNAFVPRSKLVLGISSYGYGWEKVPKAYNGLHQAPEGSLAAGTRVASSYEYRDLVQNYIPTMSRFWSRNARVPWLYDEATGLMITYDDVESVTEKANYVTESRFGGVALWDISADTTDGALLTALWNTLVIKPSN